MPTNGTLSLQDMPPEIILQVFGSLNELREVEALMLAEPIFLSIWRKYPAVPYAAVVVRSTISYPDALQLAIIQEKDGVDGKEVPRKGELMARHTRVVLNARAASSACEHFVKDVRDLPDSHEHQAYFALSLKEQVRFHRAFYLLWNYIIVFSFGAGNPHSSALTFLAQIDYRVNRTVYEVATWIPYYYYKHCWVYHRPKPLGFLTSRLKSPELERETTQWLPGCSHATQALKKLDIKIRPFSENRGYSLLDSSQPFIDRLPNQ